MTEKFLMEPVSQMILKYYLAGHFTLMNFLSDSFINHSICATYIYAVILLDICCMISSKNKRFRRKGKIHQRNRDSKINLKNLVFKMLDF